MQLTRWLSLCALVGGAAVALIEPILGRESFAAFTGANTDLRLMAEAVAFIGALTMFIGDRDHKESARRKGFPP